MDKQKPGFVKIGVVIDSWKLPIFERHLNNAKYNFVQTPGVTSNTLLLSVYTDNPKFLEIVCRSAQKEAARKKYAH